MTVHPVLKRVSRGIGEGALIVLITCVALEASLWALSACNKKFHWLTASALTDTLADPVLGSRLSPDYPDHDKDGFRNATALQQADVVAIGDSQTYGTNVAMAQAWPQQLALASGKSVYNMGVPGYGPVHSLINTPVALKKHPQWLVSALYDGNDLYDAFRLSYLGRQRTELLSNDPAITAAIQSAEAKESLETLTERLAKIYDGHFEALDAKGGSGAEPSKPSLKSRLMKFVKTYSKTWNILRNVRRTVLEKESASQNSLMGRMGWNAMKEKSKDSRGYWVPYERGNVRTVFMPSYREVALRLDDPRMAEGARISERAMKASAAEAQAAGVRFAILMIPTKELAFYEAYSGQGDAVIEQLSDLARRETEFREKFKRDVCGGDVVCIDPLPVLRDALKAGNCPYPMDSDGHPNPMGHAILAREVWKGLRARF